MVEDREIFVRNALGAWWAGSGLWIMPPGTIETAAPAKALRFSSVTAARFDVGWARGEVQFMEQDRKGAWKIIHTDRDLPQQETGT